ncbi:hypothetical protein D3C87_926250 [compost metagenome]
MNRAACIHGRTGQHQAALHDVAARQRHVAQGRLDKARVLDAAGRAGRRHFVALGGGRHVAGRALAPLDHKAVARRQQRLAARRVYGARVRRVLAQQQHIAAARGGRLGRRGLDDRAGLHLDAPQRVRERRLRAVVRVQALVAELLVADVGRRRHQVAHIDLAGAGEDHAVLVHHQHRAVGLDRAVDLAGLGRRAHHAVQHRVVHALLELHRGVAAHVERVPVQDRPRLGLLDGDDLPAVFHARTGGLGAFPFGKRPFRRPQPPFDEPVGHTAAVARRGCRARGGLRRLLRGHGRRRAVQVVQRLLQRLARLLLLAGAAADARRAAVGQPAGALRGGLHRVLVGEPARAEGPGLRMGRAGGAAGDQQRRHGLGQRRRPPVHAPAPRLARHVPVSARLRHPCLHDRLSLFQSRVFVT